MPTGSSRTDNEQGMLNTFGASDMLAEMFGNLSARDRGETRWQSDIHAQTVEELLGNPRTRKVIEQMFGQPGAFQVGPGRDVELAHEGIAYGGARDSRAQDRIARVRAGEQGIGGRRMIHPPEPEPQPGFLDVLNALAQMGGIK